jgi:glucokinase
VAWQTVNAPVLCIDIGGTSSKVGIVDAAGRANLVDSIPSRPDVESYFEALCALTRRIRAAAGPIAGIGVAVAGFLTPERDRLLYNSNLGWLEGFPLRERLQQSFDVAIELETDSNSACMAEFHFGSGGSSKRFLCVTVGTGVGVGMTVDGKPLRFAYGCLGDIGHVIVQPGGVPCSCGGRGCAEALLSAPVLGEHFAPGASLRDVIEAAKTGNAAAGAILKEAGENLGVAIASMANILFPDHIAIAGGLSAAGDLVLGAAERVFREAAGILARTNVSFTRATLGSSATLIGAAWPFWDMNER